MRSDIVNRNGKLVCNIRVQLHQLFLQIVQLTRDLDTGGASANNGYMQELSLSLFGDARKRCFLEDIEQFLPNSHGILDVLHKKRILLDPRSSKGVRCAARAD